MTVIDGDRIPCECGHAAIDHHGVDPNDGCLGIASRLLTSCPCSLTCVEVQVAYIESAHRTGGKG